MMMTIKEGNFGRREFLGKVDRCVCEIHDKICLARCPQFTHEQLDKIVEGRSEDGMAVIPPGVPPDIFARIVEARAQRMGIRPAGAPDGERANDDLDTRIAFLHALKGGL